MQDIYNIALHESGHSYSYWSQGAKLKTVVAARHGFDNEIIPSGCSGVCGGQFTGSDMVVNDATKILAEKFLRVLFAGGISEKNGGGTGGDMAMAITALGWPAHKYPAAGCDAFNLIEKYGEKEIPIEERINFFKKHYQTFGEHLQDDEQAAIEALTAALDQAPGHRVTGRDAAKIFEQVYAHAGKSLPDGVLPLDFHGEIGDSISSPEKTLDNCLFFLHFIFQRLDDADIDDRVERARGAVLQALLQVSALL